MDDYAVFEQIALVTEFKNELGAGGKDPNVQNALYYCTVTGMFAKNGYIL